MRRLVLLASIAATIAAILAAGSSAATTLCVGGNSCYPTLQAALSAAHDGDTIALAPGTFAGGVTVDVSVTIQGAGANRTTIKGGGPVLTIGTFLGATEPTVAIRGVTITGGDNSSSPDQTVAQGGGIWIPVAANQATGATVTIADSVITGNTVATAMTAPAGAFCGPLVCGFDDGGGIDNGGNLVVTNTQVTNNLVGGPNAVASGDSAGGIVNRSQASLALRHSIVSGNRVLALGPNGRGASAGGISSNGTLTVDDVVVDGNTAELDDVFPGAIDDGAFAGGIDLEGSKPVTISGTTVSRNRATSTDAVGDEYAYAGGILADSDTLQLSNSSLLGNQVSVKASGSAYEDGGGIEVDGTATMVKTLISGNVVSGSAGSGGQVVAQGGGLANIGTATLQSSIVSLNSVLASGSSGLAQGGGIWNSVFNQGDPQPQLMLIDTAVTGNRIAATHGVTVQGGGVYSSAPIARTRALIVLNLPDQCVGC